MKKYDVVKYLYYDAPDTEIVGHGLTLKRAVILQKELEKEGYFSDIVENN